MCAAVAIIKDYNVKTISLHCLDNSLELYESWVVFVPIITKKVSTRKRKGAKTTKENAKKDTEVQILVNDLKLAENIEETNQDVLLMKNMMEYIFIPVMRKKRGNVYDCNLFYCDLMFGNKAVLK